MGAPRPFRRSGEYAGIENGGLPGNYCILLNMLCHTMFECPFIGRRFGAILLIVFGRHALLWGVLGTWGLVISGVDPDARRPLRH
jgi:hypothetical protein